MPMNRFNQVGESLLEQIKAAGNTFYTDSDFWRAIAAYESGLALLELDTASSTASNDACYASREDLVPIVGAKGCYLAAVFYLNIAQAYLQLAKSYLGKTSSIDSALAGHAVMAVRNLEHLPINVLYQPVLSQSLSTH